MELLKQINDRVLKESGSMNPTADFPPHVVEQILDIATDLMHSGEAGNMEDAMVQAVVMADLPGLDSDEEIAVAARNIMQAATGKK
jgi:hypothetical protein